MLVTMCVVIAMFVSGCGGGPGVPPRVETHSVSTPSSNAVRATPPSDSIEHDLGRAQAVIHEVARWEATSPFVRGHAKEGFGLHADKSRRGLSAMVDRRVKGWELAAEFLGELGLDPGGQSSASLTKALTEPGDNESRAIAAEALGRLRVESAGPSIVAFARHLDPRNDSAAMAKVAVGLAGTRPSGAADVLSGWLRRQPPIEPGRTRGAVARALGELGVQEAHTLLVAMLGDPVDEAAAIGALRGLGALGGPRAMEALLAFDRRVEAVRIKGSLGAYRKLVMPRFICWGQMARYDSPDVHERVLRQEGTGNLSADTGDERALLDGAARRMSRDVKVAIARRWLSQDRDLRAKARSILAELTGDRAIRDEGLASLKRDYEIPVYDGNCQQTLLGLTPYARAGDPEVLVWVRRMAAAPSGPERFTSREAARQIMQQCKDPELLKLVVRDGVFDNASTWGRLTDYEATVIPGLSDAFLKADPESGSIMAGVNPNVFRFLAAESRPDVFEFLKEHILADLDRPAKSLIGTFILGLQDWKGLAVDEFLKSILTTYEKEGVTWRESGTAAQGPDKRRVVLTIHRVLAYRGDPIGVPAVYSDLDVCPRFPPGGDTRQILAKFAGRDFGPFRADWPPVEKLAQSPRK